MYMEGEYQMETIKNYLETMFANMPNTEEVLRAKKELLQMMEDKYNELIAEGQSDNTAVGTVIAEFGNLEELSEDLGISSAVKETENVNKRVITFEEVKDFLKAQSGHAIYIALGVFFCIFSVVPAILSETFSFQGAEMIGVVAMFIFIAARVFCFVFSSAVNNKWDFLNKETCYVDINSVNWLKEQKEQYRITAAMQKTIGIILCVLCFIPAMVFDEMEITSKGMDMDNLAGAFLFVFVAIGVFLIVYSNMRFGSYDKLIYLNDPETVSGTYRNKTSHDKEVHYKNKTVEAIMSVYWTTVTCIYLIWSFLTFDWHITWVVWVFGALIQTVIDTIYGQTGNEVE